MAIQISFNGPNDYDITHLPEIFEDFFFDAQITFFQPSSFTGTQYLGADQLIITGTTTNLNLDTYTGVINTLNIIGGGTITMSNLNFDLEELGPIIVDDFFGFDTSAFENYFLTRSYDITLSDNADIAPAGTLVWDSAPFNLTGNDVIRGMGGEDNLFSGNGDDQLFGGADNDRLNGGAGNDRVEGGSGDDIVLGAGGNDDLNGDGDNDRVNGGSGNDVVAGGSGHDIVVGGYGNDLTYGDDGDDRMYGGRGQDRLMGGNGLDRLYGGSSRDVLGGGDDRDFLNGGLGHDSLYGGNGWDQLFGHQGNDLLVGGTGSDDFIFRDGDGNDTIRDFDANNNAEDIILRGVTGITSFADLSANHMSQVGTSVVIEDGAGLTITLLNVDIADLGAGDFIL